MKSISNYFLKTINGYSRVTLALNRFLKSLSLDLSDVLRKILKLKSKLTGNPPKCIISSIENKLNLFQIAESFSHSATLQNTKPIIFASACVDEQLAGGWRYNGGIKELNYLVKLLRLHGYQAYMVTYDGQYDAWLIEHQPHISITEFEARITDTKNFRCVTSWATAYAFIQKSPSLYFWDMELAYTDNQHFHDLAKLYKNKIEGTAAISRTIQSWHMNNFERKCTVIPNICDESIWYPVESERNYLRIGFMNEGEHTEDSIKFLKNHALTKKLHLEFVLIMGYESDVLSIMRTCNVFVSMNIGKDILWGEGCPRTIIESLSVGCIPIAFDIIGNRETMIDGFNGFIVPRYRLDLMADALVKLYTTNGLIEQMRAQSILLVNACHKMDSRWPAVRQFLDL